LACDGKEPVAIDEEKSGIADLELVDSIRLRIVEISGRESIVRITFLPRLPDPVPGFCVCIDEVLVVEVYLWESTF
jgi:hypothetical protein